MTDRHAGYLVVLEEDIRQDDALWTINAIKHIKGVVSVKPVIGSFDVHIAEERVRIEIWEKIRALLRG